MTTQQTNSISSDNTSLHAPYWQLMIVFILALLLFSALRWQPETWVQAQFKQVMEQQSQQLGIGIHYEQLNIEGFALQLKHISIQPLQQSRLKQNDAITCDSITLTPAWSSLLHATLALHVQVVWQQQQADAIIFQQQNTLVIQSLHAQINAAALQPLLNKKLPIPLQIKGLIQIEANADIDSSHGRPLRGNIHIAWNDAAITMPSLPLPSLGSYQLDLHNNDASTPWQWNLTGGKALALNGKGQLDTTAATIQAWQLNGNIHVQADQQIPMFVSLLGKTDKQFRLTGDILHPRLQAL